MTLGVENDASIVRELQVSPRELGGVQDAFYRLPHLLGGHPLFGCFV